MPSRRHSRHDGSSVSCHSVLASLGTLHFATLHFTGDVTGLPRVPQGLGTRPRDARSTVALDPPPLRRTAAVVRDRRDVADRLHLDADVCSARIADSRPEPGPVTLTSTERRPMALAALAALMAACVAANGVPLRDPLKPMRARARPGDHVALGVGDRHDRVVERGLDVREAAVHDALLAPLLEDLLLRLPGALFAPPGAVAVSSWPSVVTPSSSWRSRPCAGPCACARWCACAGRAPAGRGGAAGRDSSRSPSGA